MSFNATAKDDPYTICQELLWSWLEQNESLMALVKPGNRGRQGQGRSAWYKRRRQSADMPELTIVPMPTDDVEDAQSSDGILREQGFQIRIVTGTMDPFVHLHPVRWQVERAVIAGYSGDVNITPKMREWLKRARIEAISSEEDNIISRNKRGWVCLLVVVFTLVFGELHIMNRDPDML